MSFAPHIIVIDPAVKRPETDCFNHLVGLSPLPLTYHLPALQGMKTLERETENVYGIVIFGSESSVNDRQPWQDPLEQWLMNRFEEKTPSFGCCYGHQMIAHMFGGKITYRTPEKKKLVGFREVELNQDPLWGTPQKGKLYVTHNEIVSELPATLTIIAKSQEVAIDGLRHKTLPIWSFQPHPEATGNFAKEDSASHYDSSAFNFGYSLLKRFLEYCAKNR